MTNPQASGLLRDFTERGLVHDVTAGLDQRLANDPAISAYIGFDPTARSLHVGNLLGIMMLSVLQRFGHRPIALGGGGTALVGDPSGKTSTRNPLTPESIWENLRGILPQFGRHLDFEGGRFDDAQTAQLVNNADWLLELRYIEFLRDIGRHFSVNEIGELSTHRSAIVVKRRPIKKVAFGRSPRGIADHAGPSPNEGNGTATVQLESA